MTPMWVQICSTSESRWLETSTVVPSSASEAIRCRTSRVPCGSRPLVGSSSTSRSRGASSARRWRAAAACRGSRRGSAWSPRRSSPTRSSAASIRAPRGARVGVAVGGVEPAQVGPAGQVGVEGRPLDQRADPWQRPPGPAGHRLPEQLDRARGGPDQPEQHPDRRGLARAVGAEEAVDRAARDDQQVDGVDRRPAGRTAWSARGTDRSRRRRSRSTGSRPARRTSASRRRPRRRRPGRRR